MARQCIVCEKGSEEVPLISFDYQDAVFSICPRHLPVLIHEPGRLAGKLAGAESLPRSDHHHD